MDRVVKNIIYMHHACTGMCVRVRGMRSDVCIYYVQDRRCTIADAEASEVPDRRSVSMKV